MSNSKQRLITIGAIALVALLAINMFLVINKVAKDKELQQKQLQLIEAEKVNVELEKQYYEGLSSLEEMRSNNEELNQLIDAQKSELADQKDQISKYLRSSKNSKAELADARIQIRELTAQAQQYAAQIDQLTNENDQLAAKNMALEEAQKILQKEITDERYRTETLESEKETLLTERASLVSEKEVLERQVNKASVIEVNNLDITTYKKRDNGKYTKKRSASNVHMVKVCFETTANDVAGSGVETFYVRILSPLGETIAVDDAGSGITKNYSNNMDMKYSQAQELDYNNDAMNTCIEWEPGIEFQKGQHLVEVYNKGHLSGTGKFVLK